MVDRGYIKTWRKIEDTSFYKDSVAVHLAIHLVLRANWEDKKTIFNGKEIVVKRGSLLAGRHKLSEQTGIKEGTLYEKLLLLQSVNFININSNNRFSIIHVVKYKEYNPPKEKTTAVPTTSQQPANTSKEVKELKNLTREKPLFAKDDLDPRPEVAPKDPKTEADLDEIILLFWRLSPLRCKHPGAVGVARDEFEAALSQGKRKEDIITAIKGSISNSRAWEVTKKVKIPPKELPDIVLLK